jgi:hypothetical protein
MERVPEDVLPIIFSYINPIYKYNLNKILFRDFYKELNIKKIYGNHSYIRNVLRSDLNFIFNNMCNIKWNNWVSLKNWRYKNWKFANFTQYILYLINYHQSHKCKDIYLKHAYDNINTKSKNKKINKHWSN